MAVRIHDTLSSGLVPLETRDPGKVAMYACGPTVYNYIHIGNARTLLWFDFIRRYLTYRGYAVTYVTNYTDVDDKIIERAKLEGLSPDAIASKYTRGFEEDMQALGVNPPDLVAKATDHIEDMVAAIGGLIDKGSAYDAGGDVFFSIESFPGYGKLSGRTEDDMRAGERVEPHQSKRHPLDFALWKSAKEGEPSWPSPWGAGRPGWHIECSVMATKYLGAAFDIHGGGSDLTFPHHENEIAQAEALSGEEPFARYWMHSGMVQMDSAKMSKSLGNVVLARDVVKHFGGEPVRYWALMSSYASQADFSEASLNDAASAYERWRTFHAGLKHVVDLEQLTPAAVRPHDDDIADAFVSRFVAALDDDLNSSQAMAVVHDLVREGNKLLERGASADREALGAMASQFIEMTTVLGLNFRSGADESQLVAGLVEILIELREQARNDRAFDRADAIRARLTEIGVLIEDTPGGTRWRTAGGPPGPGSES
jgi:cysteinyl-tRNA synthetase